MGAEALCRGARTVLGIEKSGAACRTIAQNWQSVVQPQQTYDVIKGDVVAQLSKLAGWQFHHIYFDPPYQSRLYRPVITAIAQHHLVASDGELAVEHEERHWQAIAVPGLTLRAQKRYGRTCLTFYRVTDDACFPVAEASKD
jgi:16S rRNA (guanine(966)-N(2))-methyltransferase RsmD